jgi:hypothetical protein
MTGDLTGAWVESWEAIWGRRGFVLHMPDDIYTQLYISAYDYLQNKPSDRLYELIRNEPSTARLAFRALHGRDFISEGQIVSFFEAVAALLFDIGGDGARSRYIELLRQFVGRYNLRYRIVVPFGLRQVLPGGFIDSYEQLWKRGEHDASLGMLLDHFEVTYDQYTKTRRLVDLQSCIGKATNFVEGISGRIVGRPGSLGKLLNGMKGFPHESLRAALREVYRFCCDYPGIRHGGDEKGRLRDLEERDAILVSVLLMAYAGYLSDGQLSGTAPSRSTSLPSETGNAGTP